jgi:hypothetical protein
VLSYDLSIALLHEGMVSRDGSIVTTSLTMIDVHDIARSAATYGVRTVYVVHPSPHLRSLARTLTTHWTTGYGSTYNPNRRQALGCVNVVASLDEMLLDLADRSAGRAPRLLATSAKGGGDRMAFGEAFSLMNKEENPFVLMLGTGHGMSEALLARAHYFLEPINGPTPYNHLSVRSACAIMLDRLHLSHGNSGAITING